MNNIINKTTIYSNMNEIQDLPANSNRILKIITHNGTFHSDEVFSIALLLQFLKDYASVDIIRTRDLVLIEKQQENPSIYVLDIGSKLNADFLNFDHHQSDYIVENKATVRLVLDYLFHNDFIKMQEYKFLLKSIVNFISNWDLGLEQANANYVHKPLPSVISAFNRHDVSHIIENQQFEKALSFAFEIIQNEVEVFQQKCRAQEGYERHTAISSDVVVFDDFNPHYINMLKSNNKFVKYFIHPMDDNWVVKTINSTQYPLPLIENDKHLVFAHKSRFLTIFNTQNAAFNYLSI